MLSGGVHYSDRTLVTRNGEWQTRTFTGMAGLFEFHTLEASSQRHAEISYSLPIPEDGTYQIALLYKPAPGNASNAKIAVHHAEGAA